MPPYCQSLYLYLLSVFNPGGDCFSIVVSGGGFELCLGIKSSSFFRPEMEDERENSGGSRDSSLDSQSGYGTRMRGRGFSKDPN